MPGNRVVDLSKKCRGNLPIDASYKEFAKKIRACQEKLGDCRCRTHPRSNLDHAYVELVPRSKKNIFIRLSRTTNPEGRGRVIFSPAQKHRSTPHCQGHKGAAKREYTVFSPRLLLLARRPKRMTISAGCLWIVVRLIDMAAGTNLSFGRLPLMRKMTSRAIRGGVCRLKMQLCAVGMT